MSEKESDTENVKQSRRIKDLTPAEFAAFLNRIVPQLFASGAVAFPAGRGVSARLKSWLPDFTKLTTSVLPKLHLPTADDLLPKTVALASEGWFYDPEMAYSDFQNANEALVHGYVVEADEIMREHFSLRAHEIEQRLAEQYPARASILAQAFTAHQGGQHALSVLSFLAQADGICLETRGGHFFLRDKKKNVRRKIQRHRERRLPTSSVRVAKRGTASRLLLSKLTCQYLKA